VTAKREIVQLMAADPATDPWMLHLFSGKYHIRAAWTARGGGWANTVTDEGWKGFFDHLKQAREHLVKAHEMHPEYPEAATAMIEVAMGTGGRDGDGMREWFDKAVKAQFDYFPAYNNYVWAIYPRWHGSHEEMFEFGLECLQTQRFDTGVPYQLVRICERINRDGEDDFSFYAVPQVYQAITSMFDQFEQKAPKHLDHDWYRCYHLAIAWRARRYHDAAELIKRIGHFDPRPFELVRGWATGALSEIQAMTSRQAETLRDGEQALTRGQDYAAAINDYKLALAELQKEKDHPGLLFVRYRLKQLEIERDFWDGKEVSLIPPAGQLMAPWYPTAGDWKPAQDGALVGTTRDDGQRARLLCNADFGPSYELSGKVDWSAPGDGNLASLYVGVYAEQWSHVGISRRGEVFAASAYESRTWPQQLKNDVNEITVRVNGARMSVKVNGTDVGEIRIPVTATRDVHVGLGIPTQHPGCVVRFRDVNVKLLGAAGGEQR
jgi:hypothetical protein